MSDYKRLMVLFVLLLSLLVACNPAGPEPGAVDTAATPGAGQPPAVETPAAGASDAAVAAATAYLANELGVPETEVTLLAAEATEFTDSCFGLGGPAESCLQAITPGYVVRLSANGQEYEARTDQSGSAVRLAGADTTNEAITASAVTFLADQLGLTPDDIQVISTEAMEFSDACLGLGRADESCAQVITPGYVVKLSASGQEYEARTNENGTVVRVADQNATGSANDAIAASAVTVLADKLGVTPEEITVISAEPTEFSDGCLGLGGPDESCMQAITPGYIVTLSAGGQEYVAHTDASGVQVRLANTMP